MEFKSILLSNKEVFDLVKIYSWDTNIDIKSEYYLCITDGATYVILDIDKNICNNIILIKQDNKMLNFYSLAEKLSELQIDIFYFSSERKLGNKYRFITELMGGIVIEQNGKYFYQITTKKAIEKMNKKIIYNKLTIYRDVLLNLNNIVLKTLCTINSIFQIFINEIKNHRINIGINYMENLNQNFRNRINEFFADINMYNMIVDEEEFQFLVNKKLKEEKINMLIKKAIGKKVSILIKETKNYSDDICDYLGRICRLRFNYYLENINETYKIIAGQRYNIF